MSQSGHLFLRRRVVMLALVFGALLIEARPARADALFFILDVSGSMAATDVDTIGTTRFTAMESAVQTLVGKLGQGTEIGFLTFSDAVTVNRSLTTNFNAFLAALLALPGPGGGTATGPAIRQGLAEVTAAGATGTKSMILITDGVPNTGTTADPTREAIDAATASGAASVKICVIGFGASVGVPGPDAQFLTDIATASNGAVILAPNAAELNHALDTCLLLSGATRQKKYFAPVVTFPNPAVGPGATITFAAVNTSSDTGDTAPSPITAVTVYDMIGRVVIRIPNSGFSTTQVPWNTRNSRGEPVASGMYFYIIDFQSGKQGRGKFTVVR